MSRDSSISRVKIFVLKTQLNIYIYIKLQNFIHDGLVVGLHVLGPSCNDMKVIVVNSRRKRYGKGYGSR